MTPSPLFRLDGTLPRDPAIDLWFAGHPGELGDIARYWYAVMRGCGDEVRELLHDGHPIACFGDVPFAYVDVFRQHTNVGFFQGAALHDPRRVLQGTGKNMRHIKLKSLAVDQAYITHMIEAAYAAIKHRVEHDGD